MGVLAIWRYPVKAMLGEVLEGVDVAAGGLASDRRWVVSDVETGERIANKRGPTDAGLRACRARLDAQGRLVVTLPDATTEITGMPAIAAALSALLGREVELAEHAGRGDQYMQTGGHHDFAPLHLMTTSALDRMWALDPRSDWDVRRFRPNVVLDDARVRDGDALLGAQLHGTSGLRPSVGLPTPRCVVTTRSREELPANPGLLKTIANEHRWSLGPFGRPACLGVYAEVSRAGRLDVGELLTLEPRSAATAADAVAQCVQRVGLRAGI